MRPFRNTDMNPIFYGGRAVGIWVFAVGAGILCFRKMVNWSSLAGLVHHHRVSLTGKHACEKSSEQMLDE